MTSGEAILVVGGIVILAAVATAVIIALNKKSNAAENAIETMETMEFSISDLKCWIKKNNPDMKNKVCVISFKAMERYSEVTNAIKSSGITIPEGSKTLILALLDNGDEIKKISLVIYDRLDSGINKMLSESNGAIVLEE